MTTLLFFDDRHLKRRDNIARHLGQPRWVPEATYDACGHAWTYPLVIHDAQRGLWRCFYMEGNISCNQDDFYGEPYLLLSTLESSDGVDWHAPDLTKRVPLKQRLLPNQVYENPSGLSVQTGSIPFHDPNDSEWPFKLMYYEGPLDERRGLVAVSRDGYEWELNEAMCWNEGPEVPDPPQAVYYHPQRGSYLCTGRPGYGERLISLMESKDFCSWTTPQTILTPDPLDPPLCEFYGMPVIPYEDVFLGMLWIMQTDPNEIIASKSRGRIHGELTYSYDGLVFNRTYRSPLIARNDLGEPGSGCIYPTCMVPDPNGEKLRIYSGSSQNEHDDSFLPGLNQSAIVMHELRKDGWMYLESDTGVGRLVTRLMKFDTPELELNATAPNGRIRCQFVDDDGTPFPGFTFEDSIPFTGDSTKYKVAWKPSSDMSNILGRAVRLELELVHARIYAVRGQWRWLSVFDHYIAMDE